MWLVLPAFWQAAHPIYVSVTDLAYNEQTKGLEIVHKIFIDDFEKALEDTYGINLHLGTPQEHPDTERYVREYMDTHFRVKIDNQAAKAEYLGKEADLEAVWVYREIQGLPAFKSISLLNTCLFASFDDQKNLVHVKYGSHLKSFFFKKGDDMPKEAVF